MRLLNFIILIMLAAADLSCCRTSCINMMPRNPLAMSTQIMIDKIDDVIEASIAFYCSRGTWPSSKDDIAKYSAGEVKVKISDFKKIEFSRQGDKRLNINFDIYSFDSNAFHVETYRGFCDIFIQDNTACIEKNSVELYVSDFIIYNKNSADKKPLNVPSPIIIRFENFKNRTISSIQNGYET